MTDSSLLVANRGEIAVRVMRAAAEMGMRSVAIYSEDDAGSLHVQRADEARPLTGTGAAAYLDAEQVLRVAHEAGCEAVHPGYGFLSENAAFARAAAEAGITFAGPRPEILDLFGDKVRARRAAIEAGVPVLEGSDGETTLEEARAFFGRLDGGRAMIIKAVAGGGGRGVRVVERAEQLDDAFARAASEARAAFGNGALYVEEYLPRARHIEVQMAGDASGAVTHLWERDCSVQRRYQKLVEIAPAPALPEGLRRRILDAAVRLAEAVGYDNIGTFEFLVDATDLHHGSRFAFIEANPRLQVEHTVTEEVTGVDLVRLQIELARGCTLAQFGLAGQTPEPRGFAMQVRINTERMREDGMALPAGGTLEAFEPPSGPGIRVDTFGYAGYRTSPRYDSLLAKLIAATGGSDFAEVVRRTRRALAEFRVQGVDTNIPFLRALLEHSDVAAGRVYTAFIDDHVGDLVAAAAGYAPPPAAAEAAEARLAGATVDRDDPLAVLTYGQQQAAARLAAAREAAAASTQSAPPEGTHAVEAPLQGTIVSVEVNEGDVVRPGQLLLVMEAMKMEHEIQATAGGRVRSIEVARGDTVYQGHRLLLVEHAEVEGGDDAALEEVDLDEIRPDLAEVLERRAKTRDENRPQAVERRRATGHRTTQENVEDLFDPGTIVEYGPLTLAARRARMSVPELVERSPRDGMITAVGSVNGHLFPDPVNRVATIAYDYTVFAGTQGGQNHRKADRMIKVAREARLPVVLFAEGGGGRPGDTDGRMGGPGDTRSFSQFATLSGLVPLVGITSGRCFAGNASLLGCCDVIIATADSNIGMGGPAMIEGGGLGVFAPEEIGPMEVQVPNGVVDIAVADEAEAVAVAKRYLSYFQGSVKDWEAPDQRRMRRIVPENRLRVYEVRDVIETLADVGSVLEVRKDFGVGMVTALIRVEGRPLGVVANNPKHLGGAIDSDAADKAARFMQLCDAFDLPLLFLCDTPGIMVGPEVEKTALVRHANRLFLVGANLDVTYMTVVLRKAYGLGAIAMAGGSYKEPAFTVSWPTGEFGGMGLEGSVKLGYRNELAAIEDPEARRRSYEEMVARAYENGKALNQASLFGVDDTVDPAETRTWVASTLRAAKPPPSRTRKKRPFVDGW